MTFQEIIESIESLSEEDRDLLFEIIRKRKIEARRTEIAANAREISQAVEVGTAKRGSFEEMKAYLLSDEDERSERQIANSREALSGWLRKILSYKTKY